MLAFLKGLPAGSRIGVESTGTYHELFAETAHQLGFRVFLLNPKDTHHYAKAVGLRGKTDRVDACQRRLNSDPPFADFVGVNLTHPASWLFQLLQDVTVVVLPRTWPALRLSFSRKLSPLIWTT